MKSERVIVLALIWTKWIPYVFGNTSLIQARHWLLVISQQWQPADHQRRSAANQVDLPTALCGGMMGISEARLLRASARKPVWHKLIILSHTHALRFLFSVETGGTHWPSSGGAPNLWSTKQSTHLWLARPRCDSQSRQVDPGWRHYFHWGKEFIPCAMIIFRGLSGAVAWLWHLDGWHSAGHLTGVCVSTFSVCAQVWSPLHIG